MCVVRVNKPNRGRERVGVVTHHVRNDELTLSPIGEDEKEIHIIHRLDDEGVNFKTT
jgi:hypothetical protein